MAKKLASPKTAGSNPPCNLPSEQPTQDDVSAVAVPCTDHASVETQTTALDVPTQSNSTLTQEINMTQTLNSPNMSVTLPVNPPAGAANALLAPNAGNAAAVPSADHAPPETPPMPMLGQPIPGMKPFHELVSLFPPLSAEEKEKLRADIKKNGLLEPITIWDGKIIDGRHRAMACQELGIEPKYVEYEGDDPVALVLSKNYYRRQLAPSQLAMVAGRLTSLPKGRPGLSSQCCAFSQEEAAKQIGVSRRVVQQAYKVCTKAIPEVAEAVEAGKLSVSTAAKLADQTPEVQREVAATVMRGEKCPAFQPEEEKASKEVSLEEQLADELKAALKLPRDSQERSDALTDVFAAVVDECFVKKSPLVSFLQGIAAKCAEYDVLPPIATEA